MPNRKIQVYGVTGAFRRIVKLQLFAKVVRGNPDDTVHLRVKVGGSAQSLDSDAVLLDFRRGAFEVFLANETQKSAGTKEVSRPLTSRSRITSGPTIIFSS
jgi:hypothetical protein